jgi:branched-chain amino acid transport system ATP-binding protein
MIPIGPFRPRRLRGRCGPGDNECPGEGNVELTSAETIILATEDLTKDFAGFVAVTGVNLRVSRGTIHALIGPNGAGKTTCFNLLTKFLKPTRGRIIYKGEDITALPPAYVARLGLVRSFQISAVFPHLTVLENVRIALQRKRGGSFDFWRSNRVLNGLNDRAMNLIADVGLAASAGATASELPYGRKRALELATTLALDPELLLLDEPTAGMGHEDIDQIATLIKAVATNRTVLMVEHNLSVVATLSDRITVLTRGRILAEGDYQGISANPEVREAYLGVGHD